MKKFKVKKEVSNEDDSEFIIDVENEQYLLACILNHKKLQNIFDDLVESSDFIIENHKPIAWCIKEAISRKRQVTPEILQILISEYKGKKKFTGLKYLYNLINSQDKEPTTDNIRDHINKLKSDKVKHTLYHEYMNTISNMVRNPHSSIEGILTKLDSTKTFIENSTTHNTTTFFSMADIDKEHDEMIIERNKGIEFQTTGYTDLDEHLTEGMAKKKISVIAGRPGMCKSAMVDNIALRLGRHGSPCAIFSLEMDRLSSYDRFISICSDLPLMKLVKERKNMTPEELKIEKDCKEEMVTLPIYIFDKAAPTMETIYRQLKYLKEEQDIKVAFIDLFDKVQISQDIKNKSTADQISNMLNYTQKMAKDLNVHICIVNQISRKAEARKNKRPVLSDLKNSGAFEEIADLILLLYRESYYLTGTELQQYMNRTRDIDILEVHIAKQRQGVPNEIIKMEFVGPQTKIIRYRE